MRAALPEEVVKESVRLRLREILQNPLRCSAQPCVTGRNDVASEWVADLISLAVRPRDGARPCRIIDTARENGAAIRVEQRQLLRRIKRVGGSELRSEQL